MVETFLNFVANEWKPSRSHSTFENENPAQRGSVLGCFHLIAGILNHELEFGPLECGDATLCVDVVDRKLRTDTHQLSLPRHSAGHRRNQGNLDIGHLGMNWRALRDSCVCVHLGPTRKPVAIRASVLHVAWIVSLFAFVLVYALSAPVGFGTC